MQILLPDAQILELAGADAIAFAQAQFASDLTVLRNGHWQWSAWLSAQGRVRAFFHLLRLGDERLLLLLRGGAADDLRRALARFVFRARVSIDVVQTMRAAIAPTQASTGGAALAEREIGFAASGCMALLLPGEGGRTLSLLPDPAMPVDADASAEARNAAALADIDAGLPTLTAALDDLLLPDWLGLRELGAVSVGKGCYPGQEIVARLHFKGGNKRWLHRVTFASPRLPSPSARLRLGAADDEGIVICAAWSEDDRGRALVALREDHARLAVAGANKEIEILSIERVIGSRL
ncbi:MAG: folate-binding protein [Rudaea sp.]